ncbi:hypothetical protein F480_01530 [Bibersteinia trehalosi Y31]|uniref:Uncharacterized protein n=3 Tax=Pasteurellaceae TaxID=712 RepID=A0A179CZ93_BIBTR|nr:hypothetical protein [Bibersteinia trehalosi]OAQ15253.1 hypothetical protein F480_01530 [Bibersteinia trehalosi Y31]TCT18438.1 hypothetical protein EDC51_101153 [Bibersteinia trehalosi]
MKIFSIIVGVFCLIGCSFGGFKPPQPYYKWRLHDSIKLYPPSQEGSFFELLTHRENDMRSCGMDPVLGESDKLKVNLCMEKKGWYLEQGPVCEEKDVWNEPECIKWRAKHSKPNAKPWG